MPIQSEALTAVTAAKNPFGYMSDAEVDRWNDNTLKSQKSHADEVYTKITKLKKEIGTFFLKPFTIHFIDKLINALEKHYQFTLESNSIDDINNDAEPIRWLRYELKELIDLLPADSNDSRALKEVYNTPMFHLLVERTGKLNYSKI